MTQVVLYERPGCHLCDDALIVLERVRDRVAFTLSRVNIESDPELLKAYLERIPVVTVDGTEAFEFFVDGPELERRLNENRRPPHPAVE